MNRVPIVFAIDKNVVIPCGVTITSLLRNAGEDTFYQIFILCDGMNLTQKDRTALAEAFRKEEKCSLSFVDVGDAFKEAESSAIDYITKATYYRLAIPTLFPQSDLCRYRYSFPAGPVRFIQSIFAERGIGRRGT